MQTPVFLITPGSLLAEIVEAEKKGSSVEEPSVMEATDREVGEMNRLERAIHFLYREYARKAEDLIGDIKAAYGDLEKADVNVVATLIRYTNRAKAAHDILWDTIHARLGIKESRDYAGWRIRSTGFIVLCPEKIQNFPLKLITNALDKIPGFHISTTAQQPDSQPHH